MQINQGDFPTVVSVVAAQSNTGKTTLIEGLIHYFKNRNYRIGVLKHDAHRFEIDKKGKDSFRFSEAGADTVIISSSDKIAMIQKNQQDVDLEQILRLFEEMDLVLIEGYRNNNYMKLEVHRQEMGSELLYENSNFCQEDFIAIVSDISHSVPIPVLSINRVNEVGAYLETKILKGR